MVNFLLALLSIAGLSIVFLYLKMKRAAVQSVGFKAEQDQRAANEELKIKTELERRDAEAKEKSTSAKEAIDKFDAAMRELRDSTN